MMTNRLEQTRRRSTAKRWTIIWMLLAVFAGLHCGAIRLHAQQESPLLKRTEQVVLIVISPNGIWPVELRVKPGPFRLEIRNRTPAPLPELEIESSSKQIARSFSTRSEFKSREREHAELVPGTKDADLTARPMLISLEVHYEATSPLANRGSLTGLTEAQRDQEPASSTVLKLSI